LLLVVVRVVLVLGVLQTALVAGLVVLELAQDFLLPQGQLIPLLLALVLRLHQVLHPVELVAVQYFLLSLLLVVVEQAVLFLIIWVLMVVLAAAVLLQIIPCRLIRGVMETPQLNLHLRGIMVAHQLQAPLLVLVAEEVLVALVHLALPEMVE
jgi:hypothetical protein